MANIHHLAEKQPEIYSILKKIGEVANSKEKEVYVVGGVVRDLLLDRPLKEIDLMVVGDGIEFANTLAKEMGVKKIIPFPKFSTAHIPFKPVPIEVAAAREETYNINSRKPQKVNLY
jgi:tRNA nucleotidyltransferase/poly(A) polymerase